MATEWRYQDIFADLRRHDDLLHALLVALCLELTGQRASSTLDTRGADDASGVEVAGSSRPHVTVGLNR